MKVRMVVVLKLPSTNRNSDIVSPQHLRATDGLRPFITQIDCLRFGCYVTVGVYFSFARQSWYAMAKSLLYLAFLGLHCTAIYATRCHKNSDCPSGFCDGGSIWRAGRCAAKVRSYHNLLGTFYIQEDKKNRGPKYIATPFALSNFSGFSVVFP